MAETLQDRLRRTTEAMASSASVQMDLWNEHSNACLEAADALDRKATISDEAVEAALAAWYPGEWPDDPVFADTDFAAEQRSEMRAALTAAAPYMGGGWQPIETAPKMKNVLLWAATDVDEEGRVRNWKMGTGFYHTGWENDRGDSPWNWEGQHIAPWDATPTHWKPLPEPPAIRQQKEGE